MNYLRRLISTLIDKRYTFNYPISNNKKSNTLFEVKRLKDVNSFPVYIIYRDNGGSGFFSNLLFVFRHIQIAEKFGFIPFIDFLNFPTIYSLDNNPHYADSWNIYFEPVSTLSLEQAYQAPNLIFCDGKFPNEYPMSYDIGKEESLCLFKEKISIKESIQREIILMIQELNIIKNNTLGIHWRGNEQNRTKGHWFGPTKHQIFKNTDKLLSSGYYSQIYLSTECLSYFNLFKNRYGQLVVYSDYPRSDSNIYKRSIRKDHYYLLGKEILTEGVILSKCMGLIHGSSNVSDFAAFFNNNVYNERIEINNGENRSNHHLISYNYKILLPYGKMGLKNEIIHYKKNNSI